MRGGSLARQIDRALDAGRAARSPASTCLRSDAYTKAPYWGTGDRPDMRRTAWGDSTWPRHQSASRSRPATASHPAQHPRPRFERPRGSARVLRQRHRHRSHRADPDQRPRRPQRHQDLRSACPRQAPPGPTSSPAIRAATWQCSNCSIRRPTSRRDHWAMAAMFGRASSSSPCPTLRRRVSGDAAERISYGLVSSLRRTGRQATRNEMRSRSKITLHHYGTLIQTDAQTTPGCSGGASLDLDGEGDRLDDGPGGRRSDKPGGYAIPFDANTRRIIEVLKRGEEVEYGFLGVMLQNQTPDADRWSATAGHRPRLAGQPGRACSRATRSSSINGNAGQQQRRPVSARRHGPGRARTVRVERSPGERTRAPTRSSWPSSTCPDPVLASKRPPATLRPARGLHEHHLPAQPLSAVDRAPAEGVVIREVIPDSPADKAQLQTDKVITAVNGQAVTIAGGILSGDGASERQARWN